MRHAETLAARGINPYLFRIFAIEIIEQCECEPPSPLGEGPGVGLNKQGEILKIKSPKSLLLLDENF